MYRFKKEMISMTHSTIIEIEVRRNLRLTTTWMLLSNLRYMSSSFTVANTWWVPHMKGSFHNYLEDQTTPSLGLFQQAEEYNILKMMTG